MHSYYTERSKSERKTPIQYINAYIWNFERTVMMTLYGKQQKRQRYKEQKVRVGWFERIALKRVYYHMWNRSPVQVRCMKQGMQSSCTGTNQRDGMGKEVGGEFRTGGHMYSCGWFMSMYGKTHHNIVKWLASS